MGDEELCGYVGCENFVYEGQDWLEPSLRLCRAHALKIDSLIADRDTPGILRFWSKAYGGHKALAGEMVGEIGA